MDYVYFVPYLIFYRRSMYICFRILSSSYVLCVLFFLSDFLSTYYVYCYSHLINPLHIDYVYVFFLSDCLSTDYVYAFSHLMFYPLIMCILFHI